MSPEHEQDIIVIEHYLSGLDPKSPLLRLNPDALEALWSCWSDIDYHAGWIIPSESAVKRFAFWLFEART